MGLMTTLATMASSGIVLHVLIPLVRGLALDKEAIDVAAEADFTNLNER